MIDKSTLKQHVQQVEQAVDDATKGLPECVFEFATRIVPMVNVDLLIQDSNGRNLFTWRSDSIYGEGWHIPGGIIRFKETMGTRISEVARLELGATVRAEPTPLCIVEAIEPTRATRGHFIAFLFRCELLTPPDDSLKYQGAGMAHNGQWAWIEGCPPDLLSAQNPYKPYLTRSGAGFRVI